MAQPKSPDPSAHPLLAEIETFFAGTLESPARLRVFRHLLGGCEECLALCRPVLAVQARAFAPEAEPDAYDPAIDRALDGLRRKVRAWGELAGALPAAESRRPEISRPAQIEWLSRLIGVARALRGAALEEYFYFADQALDAASVLVGTEPVERELWDLVARARAERANAWRLAGSTAEAIGELELARLDARKGAEGVPLMVEIASLEASVYIAARQFNEADTLLMQLVAVHRTTGDSEARGKTLMQVGNVAYFRGEFGRAAEAYVAAHDNLISSHADLASFAFKNGVDALVRAGLFVEAGQLLPDLRRCLEPHASPIEIRKLRWMEAKCVAGIGYQRRAAVELWNLAAEFGAMKLPYHQALVVLDLCGIWLDQGLYAEIAEAACNLIRTFAELDVEREAWKAIVLLEQAARQQRATQNLLAAAIRQVEGLQNTGAHPAR